MGTSIPRDNDMAKLRFASVHLPPPPNAAPPTPSAFDLESATALFAHAVLLFHEYCWHQSIKLHRSILRRDISGLLPASQLWFNIGIIRGHLGEYALAVEALDKAVEDEPELAVAWFTMGISLFHLGDFRRAERRFKKCLACLETDIPAVDYKTQGLPFLLERIRIEFNIRLCLLWKLHKQVKAERPPPWSLNRLPAGLLFGSEVGGVLENAPAEGNGLEGSVSEAASSKSSALRIRPKNLRKLFQRRWKTTAHSASSNKPIPESIMLSKVSTSTASSSPPRLYSCSPPPQTRHSTSTTTSSTPLLRSTPSQSSTLIGDTAREKSSSIRNQVPQRTDSFALIAPEEGLFQPLPPLPAPSPSSYLAHQSSNLPLPIPPPPYQRSRSPPRRFSFIAARRLSSFARLNGERIAPSAPPRLLSFMDEPTTPAVAVRGSLRTHGAGETLRRDSLAIFSMGVLEEEDDEGLACDGRVR